MHRSAQGVNDGCFDPFRWGCWREAGKYFAIATDQKFSEVPFDFFGAENARRGFFQMLKQRMRGVAVDIDFRNIGKLTP